MKRLIASFVCSALLAASIPATAESSRSSRSAQADVLFHQAQALLDSGRFDAACAKFEASETLESGLGTLLHLGDCYEHAGRTASAWHTFLEAEAVAQAKKDNDREQVAAQRVAALEPKLIRVVFVVPQTSRVPGLTVQLGSNAIPAGAWGTIIPVDSGMQQINVSAVGYSTWHLALDVSHGEGKQFRVNVPALDPQPQANASLSARSDRRRGFRTAGVVTGSVGLAGIGAGAVFNALSRNSDDATTCNKGVVQCTPTKSNKSAYSDVSTVSLALGGALLATGVTLFVLAPSPDNQEQHALRVAAHVATNGGRLQLEGAW